MILNLLVLRSSAPHELAAFYEGLGLSFVRERHGNGPEHLACSTRGAIFEIYPEQDGQSTRGTRIGFAVDDVDASFASALAGNAHPVPQAGRRSLGADAPSCATLPVMSSNSRSRDANSTKDGAWISAAFNIHRRAIHAAFERLTRSVFAKRLSMPQLNGKIGQAQHGRRHCRFWSGEASLRSSAS